MKDRREEVLKEIYAAFAARRREPIQALLPDHFEFHPVTGRQVGRTEPYRGREGFSEYFADVDRVWTELRLRVDRFQHSGDRTLCVGRAWARNDDVVIDSPTGWIWTFEEGTAVPIKCTVHDDLMAALEEFGDGERG
ncbi:MAG: hypothetical protein QOG62_2142 [Thermoleophilaceae bacterium]|nr:hypothetical protein [Thermoleophilaceae bacterium]